MTRDVTRARCQSACADVDAVCLCLELRAHRLEERQDRAGDGPAAPTPVRYRLYPLTSTGERAVGLLALDDLIRAEL